eukprot:TCONS_00049017-protein
MKAVYVQTGEELEAPSGATQRHYIMGPKENCNYLVIIWSNNSISTEQSSKVSTDNGIGDGTTVQKQCQNKIWSGVIDTIWSKRADAKKREKELLPPPIEQSIPEKRNPKKKRYSDSVEDSEFSDDDIEPKTKCQSESKPKKPKKSKEFIQKQDSVIKKECGKTKSTSKGKKSKEEQEIQRNQLKKEQEIKRNKMIEKEKRFMDGIDFQKDQANTTETTTEDWETSSHSIFEKQDENEDSTGNQSDTNSRLSSTHLHNDSERQEKDTLHHQKSLQALSFNPNNSKRRESPSSHPDISERRESPSSHHDNSERQEFPASHHDNSERWESPSSHHVNSERQEFPASHHDNSERWEAPSSQHANSERQEFPASHHVNSERRKSPSSHHVNSERQEFPASHHANSERREASSSQHANSERQEFPASHHDNSERREAPSSQHANSERKESPSSHHANKAKAKLPSPHHNKESQKLHHDNQQTHGMTFTDSEEDRDESINYIKNSTPKPCVADSSNGASPPIMLNSSTNLTPQMKTKKTYYYGKPKSCHFCFLKSNTIKKLEEQIAGLKQDNARMQNTIDTGSYVDTGLPKPGLLPKVIAEKYKMEELVPGMNVYVSQEQLKIVQTKKTGTSAISFLLDTFYLKETQLLMNVTGANDKKRIDPPILSAMMTKKRKRNKLYLQNNFRGFIIDYLIWMS